MTSGESHWFDLFEKTKESDFLMGIDSDWTVNLTWLVDYDNAIKVINSNYENKNKFTYQVSDDIPVRGEE